MASFDFDLIPTPRLIPFDTSGDLLLAADFDYIPPEASGGISPPVVTVISPTPGAPLAANGEVVIEVTDVDEGVRLVEIFVDQPEMRGVVYDGANFVAPFNGSRATIAGGYRFTFRRSGGWRFSNGVRFYARAFDQLGTEF